MAHDGLNRSMFSLCQMWCVGKRAARRLDSRGNQQLIETVCSSNRRKSPTKIVESRLRILDALIMLPISGAFTPVYVTPSFVLEALPLYVSSSCCWRSWTCLRPCAAWRHSFTCSKAKQLDPRQLDRDWESLFATFCDGSQSGNMFPALR